MWNEIKNQDDINNLMHLFGDFHDSCIKELKYMSGAYVNEDLSMYPINDKRILRVVFQRQFSNPSAIEMEFCGLRQLKLNPEDLNVTCEILDASMKLHEGFIYWCDSGYLSQHELGEYKGNLICAAKVCWRAADEYIGSQEVYGEKNNG